MQKLDNSYKRKCKVAQSSPILRYSELLNIPYLNMDGTSNFQRDTYSLANVTGSMRPNATIADINSNKNININAVYIYLGNYMG